MEQTMKQRIEAKNQALHWLATQLRWERTLEALKFILFVNQPKLLSETYARYLEGRIRAAEPYSGLPVRLSCRARAEKM